MKTTTINVAGKYPNNTTPVPVAAEVYGPLAIIYSTNKYGTSRIIHIRTGLDVIQIHDNSKKLARQLLSVFLGVPLAEWEFGSFGEALYADIPASIHAANKAAREILYPEKGKDEDRQ